MILITTSRRPTRRGRSFCKDLAQVIPGAVKINRGKKSVYEVLAEAVQRGLPYVLIVETWKGNPGSMLFYRASATDVKKPLAIFRVKGVKLQREIRKDGKIGKVERVVIESKEQTELTKFLSKIFEVSRDDEENKVVSITISSSGEEFIMDFKIGGEEVGPRIKFKVLRLGSL
ncbi:MAG: hypothetical protein QXZ06_06800 [Candidatus Jordarchaeales archaeon]